MRVPLLEGSNRRHRLRMMPAPFILAMGMTLTASMAAASDSANIQPDWQARDWAMACMTCHNAAAPASAGKAALRKLEGRPAAELVAALQGLRNGKAADGRSATLMPQLLKGYRDDELQRIAAYFASQSASQSASQPGLRPPSQVPAQSSASRRQPVAPATARAPQ
ncbi:c-type cytochrome [Pandoraea pneumonica]|uniref:c-type cytochrome n=1 Tax=Pandoraea pneumonica TaxID=2508299 RepID=UPI003CEB247D